MDEPEDKTVPDASPPDSDATIIVGRAERAEDDATATHTVSAPSGPAPGVPPGAAKISGGGKPPEPRAAGDVEQRAKAARQTDDATATRVAAMSGAPPKMPVASPPPVTPPRPPVMPPPVTPPPVGPPSRAADSGGPATRTIVAPPQPPKLDRLVAQAKAGTSIAPSSAPSSSPSPRAPGARADAEEPTRVAHDGDVPDDATVVRRSPTGRPRLVLTSPDGGTREVPLTAPDVSIGRAKNCDVILTNTEVSRLHARIVLRGPNHVLVPVGTHRNTYVNGELALDERLLCHGDVIRLASEELVYAETEHLAARGGGQRTPRAGASAFLFAIVGGLAAVAVAAAVWFAWGLRQPQSPSSETARSVPQQRDVAPAGGAANRIVSPPDAPPAPPAAPAAPMAPAANAAPPIDPRAEQVSKLVYQGDIAFVEKKYTTPPDGSALYAYREALKLDPQNTRARNQIGLIIERYLELAERALDMNDRASARLYTDKATYVHQEVDDVGDRAEIERHLQALGKRLGTSHR